MINFNHTGKLPLLAAFFVCACFKAHVIKILR